MADHRGERPEVSLADSLYWTTIGKGPGGVVYGDAYTPPPVDKPDGPAAGEPLEAPPPPEPEPSTPAIPYDEWEPPVGATPAVPLPEREPEPVKSPAMESFESPAPASIPEREPLEPPAPPVPPDAESADIFRAHQESLASWRAEYPSEAAWNRARQQMTLGRDASPAARREQRIENAVERTERKQDIIRARRRQPDKQFRELGDRRPPKSATTALEPPLPDWPAVGAMTEPPSPIPKTETPWIMPFEPAITERDLPELKAPEPPGVAEQPAVEAPQPSAQRAAFVPSAPIVPHGTSLLRNDNPPSGTEPPQQSIGRSPRRFVELEPPVPDARTGAREPPIGYHSGQALDMTQRQLDRNAEVGVAQALRYDLINFTRDQDLATGRANALQHQLNRTAAKDSANDYRRLEWITAAAENSRETLSDTVF